MGKKRKAGGRRNNKLHDEGAATVVIPSSAIRSFVELYYKFYPDEALRNPERAIRRRLRDAVCIEPGYFAYRIWKKNEGGFRLLKEGILFQIKDQVLVNIAIFHILSLHAKVRLTGRFQISKPDARGAIEIANGRIISHTEKSQLGIEKEKTAVRFQDRVYLIGTENTVITVIDMNSLRQSV